MPARSWASPESPATARTSSSRQSSACGPVASGRVKLDGEDITGARPRKLHELNVAYVPADRHRFGLILSFSIQDNLVLNRYMNAPFARRGVRNEAAIAAEAEENIGEFDIRTPSPTVNAGTLSGGNQQKVVVAREFDRDLKLLVLDQPTRGLDVGSVEFIHRQAIDKRDAGTAILLVSAELDEVLEMSDRIVGHVPRRARRRARRPDGRQERDRAADGHGWQATERGQAADGGRRMTEQGRISPPTRPPAAYRASGRTGEPDQQARRSPSRCRVLATRSLG